MCERELCIYWRFSCIPNFGIMFGLLRQKAEDMWGKILLPFTTDIDLIFWLLVVRPTPLGIKADWMYFASQKLSVCYIWIEAEGHASSRCLHGPRVQVSMTVCVGTGAFFRRWPLSTDTNRAIHSYVVIPKHASMATLFISAFRLTMRRNILCACKHEMRAIPLVARLCAHEIYATRTYIY